MAHNSAHNALVKAALERLAIEGYTAWKNETGVWFEHDDEADDGKGRPHKYGKKGSGDIFIVLPKMVTLGGAPRQIGWHIEAEAKTGSGRQSKNQSDHQKFCVERNGGAYILFYSIDYLLQELDKLRKL